MTGAEIVVEGAAVAIDGHVAIFTALEPACRGRSAPATAASAATALDHDHAKAAHHVAVSWSAGPNLSV